MEPGDAPHEGLKVERREHRCLGFGVLGLGFSVQGAGLGFGSLGLWVLGVSRVFGVFRV